MSEPTTRPPQSLLMIAGIGAAGVVASYFAVEPQRFWANWVLWFIFLLTVGLGCLFIIALEHLIGARWSIPIRRVPERLSGILFLVVPLAIVALFALPVLYPWTNAAALQNRVVAAKTSWLNVPFFVFRVLLCLALWIVSYRILVTGSFAQDETREPAFSVRARKFAPAFLIVFALTITLVAFDWISSMEPAWFSDILGVYLFAGCFLSGLGATALGVIWLMERGRLPSVRGDHLYNLGAFLFAFSVFWAYIGFSQYMLMWYANMPEEVFWYAQRIEGAWLPVILALAALRFVVPFFALASRDSKIQVKRLRRVAVLILLGQFLDLYWLIFPAIEKKPVFSWTEISFCLCFGALSLLWMRKAMTQGKDMPVGDPFLQKGLEFRL